MQDLRQLAAGFVLKWKQQEGHRDDASQQKEDEGAGGQLLMGTWKQGSLTAVFSPVQLGS